MRLWHKELIPYLPNILNEIEEVIEQRRLLNEA